MNNPTMPLTYPHNDNVMTYDYLRHRYVLTNDALYTYLGLNFNNVPEDMDANPSSKADRFAQKVSDQVYRFILRDSMNSAWLTFEMAILPELRQVIQDMLLAQAEYDVVSGFSDTFSGLDAFRGKAIDRRDLREAVIAPAVEDYAYMVQPCIGRCLKYAGQFGYIAPDFVDKDGNNVY